MTNNDTVKRMVDDDGEVENGYPEMTLFDVRYIKAQRKCGRVSRVVFFDKYGKHLFTVCAFGQAGTDNPPFIELLRDIVEPKDA